MISRRQPRVAVIGLDAADSDLLRLWAGTGKLPHVAKLLADGAAMSIRNPPGLYAGAVWPTLFTGVSPTRHGRYCYEQFVPGSYGTRAFVESDYRYAPFWVELARRGLKVVTVDVPKSPSTIVPGTYIWDWGTHDPEPTGFHCWPSELKDELLSRFGTEPVGVCDSYDGDVESVRIFQERLLARIETKTRMFVELTAGDEWDFFFGVFADSHCVGHQCWSVHDASNHHHNIDVARALGDPIETVYRGLDRAIGHIVESLPADTVVLLVASHGMGSHYDANFLLADMIAAMHTSRARTQAVGFMQKVWHGLPRAAQSVIKKPLVRIGRRLSERRAGVPPGLGSALRAPAPSRLPYFAVPNNDAHGALRINLSGREPAGCVTHAELESVILALREDLTGFLNEDTGRPVVVAIHRIEDLYPDEPVGDLPDLIIDWDRSVPIYRIRSHKYGRLARPPPSRRTGDHRPGGLLISRGPGIAPGSGAEVVNSTALAAIVSALFGIDRPDLDGPAITAVLSSVAIARR